MWSPRCTLRIVACSLIPEFYTRYSTRAISRVVERSAGFSENRGRPVIAIQRAGIDRKGISSCPLGSIGRMLTKTCNLRSAPGMAQLQLNAEGDRDIRSGRSSLASRAGATAADPSAPALLPTAT